MIGWLTRLLGVNALLVKIGLAALLVGILVTGKCVYDRSIIKAHDDGITRKTLETDFEAKLQAADERARDQAEIATQERKRQDEIRKATDSKPSAPRNRLNCERLRRSGADTSRFPECG